MKKLLYKNYIFIIVVAFIMSFSIGYFTTNNGLNEEELTPDRAANYDKMKISYARIVERKTGVEPFDSVSDENGHDASETDNYVRTFDRIYYTLEVGIERNEYTTSPTDNFWGGAIKVKITLPKDEKNHPILYVDFDEWMDDRSYSRDFTEVTATYVIPDNKAPVGGNQELTFNIKVGGNTKILTGDVKPTFEVWMEGNKPDNSDSQIDSIVVKDPKDIIITGVLDATEELYPGMVNNASTVNGVKGQFISFVAVPTNKTNTRGRKVLGKSLDSNLKVDYYYKETTSNEWINLSTIDELSNKINGTELYSYGRACETTPGFWPKTSLNMSNYGWNWLCAKMTSSTPNNSRNEYYSYDSGTLTASMQDEIISFENVNFYSASNGAKFSVDTLAGDGFELFVPWYEPENKQYDYKIVISIVDLNIRDENDVNHTFTSDDTISFEFKNYLTGEGIYDFTVDSNYYYDKDNPNEYIFHSYGRPELELIPYNRFRKFYSYFKVIDGPYDGGIERLISWNSKYASLFQGAAVRVLYNNVTIMPTPTLASDAIMYGVYKNNRSEGLTTDELVNSAETSDFDWYTSKAEANSNGTITAIKVDERNYYGYNIQTMVYVPIEAKQQADSIYHTGIIRHKIKLCYDENRTNCINFDDEYISTLDSAYNSDSGHRRGNPEEIGETYYVTPAFAFVNTTNTDKENGSIKRKYDVKEEVINMVITPTLEYTVGLENQREDFFISASIPAELTYVSNSANISPDEIVNNSDGTTTLKWNFYNHLLNESLPEIYYQLEMSPYINNNSSKSIDAKLSSSGNFMISYYRSAVTLSFTNLSGQSIRERLSKDYGEHWNKADDISRASRNL